MKLAASTPQLATVKRYAPSWVDRLIAWIEHLPLPSWLVYVFVLLIIALMNNALQWFDGALLPGTFDWRRIADAIFPIYFLALIHYLNTVAHRALDAFQPALDISDADAAAIRYRLTTVPAGIGYTAAIIGIILGIIAVQSGSANFGILGTTSLVTLLYTYVRSAFTSAVGAAFVAHTIRQLRLINHIHRQATRITIFQSVPVYAFSALSARTGIGLVFFSAIIIGLNTKSGLDSVSLSVVALFMLASVAAFLLPLNGMHRHLVTEKARLIGEANRRIEALIAKLHQRVDTDSLDNIGDLNSAMGSLITERDFLEKLSTWPWDLATLRGFITAVLLPIVLYLITRALDSILHF